MKKYKFYYSEPVHIRTIPVVTDAEGTPIFIPNARPIKVKSLPRITVASVWDTDTNIMNFGSAICSPKDTYKRKVGREVALKRALKFPEVTVKLTKRNKTRSVSQRYADQLISQHLNPCIQDFHQYVHAKV